MFDKIILTAVKIASNKKLMMGMKATGFALAGVSKGIELLSDLETQIDTTKEIRKVAKEVTREELKNMMTQDERIEKFLKEVS